jgi:hypothetical protein
MAITTLTTVLQTVQATSVKLAAPARTGRGLATVDANYPADALSRQLPLPNPDSEPNPGDRQDPAGRMRGHPPAAVAVEPPAGPAGVHVPGSPVRTRAWSDPCQPFTGWRGLTATTRANPPVASSPSPRPGSDCQSPGRRTDLMAAKRGDRPAAAAGK